MSKNELDQDQKRSAVRDRYARAAEGAGCGCRATGESCCEGESAPQETARDLGYSEAETSGAPEGANLGLGCGNPTAIASLKAGETVIDLGSGAGFDVFLAAKAVGPGGRVIGVDMTPAMISKARSNKVRGGYPNVEFRLGEIENLPVADSSADVIISNCVINLSPDKPRVFREAWRALKPAGRLVIADVVAREPMPEKLRSDWEFYLGCVTGATPVDALKRMLLEAGFVDIRIEPRPTSAEIVGSWFPEKGLERYLASANIEAVKPGPSR